LPHNNKPAALILTRQNVPTIDRKRYASADGALRGGYILADCEGKPDVILIGTGSEVQLCLAAYEKLRQSGVKVRVISMPCRSLFENQYEEYLEKVLPKDITARVVVEAGVPMGWERYVNIDKAGLVLGMESFGASAPAGELMKKFGFTVDAVVNAARFVIDKKKEELLNSSSS